MFNSRIKADKLYGPGIVNSVTGLILLPDEWQCPDGLSFTPGMDKFLQNAYTVEQWEKMEEAGAVFLPAAGYCDQPTSVVGKISTQGRYWSTYGLRIDGFMLIYPMQFSEGGLTFYNSYNYSFYRESVRLVQDVK